MDTMTLIVREIHRLQILSDIRRQQANVRPGGDRPARRLEVDEKRAAVILAELIDEGLVTLPPAPGAGIRLSAAGEDLLASVRRRNPSCTM